MASPASGGEQIAVRGMPRTAVFLGIASWVLGLLALLLYFTSSPSFDDDWLFIVVDALVAAVYGTVAAVVLARRRHIVGILLAITALGGGLAAFGGGWRQFASVNAVPPLEDIRALSRSLLPPVLDELGLRPALLELVTRHRDNGLHIDLTCDGVDDLDPAVAAAAYAIASEAVINVNRHSGTNTCELRVTTDDGVLRVRCRDAGKGLAADRAVGVGSRAMRERAEEQGGTLTISPLEPHGTSVEAQIPVRRR